MRLNDSTLRSKLKASLESSSFQKKYVEQLKFKQYKWYWDDSDVEDVVNKLKREIWLASELLTQNEQMNSSSMAGMDYRELLHHRVTNIKRDPSNPKWIVSCRVELYFNPDWVHRPSLYPDPVHGYPQGVDNIVRLLTNGWDFRGRQDKNPYSYSNMYRHRMHGDWIVGGTKSGKVIHNVYAVSYRRGSPLLFAYIDDFNRTNEGVYATLNETYHYVSGIGGLRPDYNKSGNSQIDSWRISGIGTIRFGLKL